MADLSKVGARERLKPRKGNEPYWHRLQAGCFIGYRPSLKDKHGKWLARVYDEDKKGYERKPLGDFGHLDGNKRFAAAKTEAELFKQVIDAGGDAAPRVQTVGDACRQYSITKDEAEARFKRYVYSQPIAKVRLDKLRKKHLQEWREWLESQPALVSRSKTGAQKSRKRAPSTVNRDMAVLRAALSKVIPKGAPNTPAAWQEAITAIKNADGRRRTYLTREERADLLSHMDGEAEPFFRALCLLPIRVGALAALSVKDFDAQTMELTIAKDKAGEARRIEVPPEVAKLLSKQMSDKLPSAPLFMRKDGSRWNRHTWKRPMVMAAKAADLPPTATAYTLRHSTITDLVKAKLPLLTIAQISGTSVEMIEKHYGHLANEAAVEALGTLAL